MALTFADLFLCSVVTTLLLLSHVVVSGLALARSGMCGGRQTQWCDVGRKSWERRMRMQISLRGDQKAKAVDSETGTQNSSGKQGYLCVFLLGQIPVVRRQIFCNLD